MTKKLNQVLALVLNFMALLAVGFTISFSACTQQQAKHYDDLTMMCLRVK
jgi:hypothetical protein